MGGGGEHYSRDTSDGYRTTAGGFSETAQQMMGRSRVDPGVLTVNRTIESRARTVVALLCDVTGSVDALPLIFTDKLPMVAGQIAQLGYLEEPEVSLAAVGDLTDEAPMQVGDFARVRDLDDWVKRLWREKGGGSNDTEAYAFMAYYYAYCCDIPNADTAFCVFIADEGMERTLYKGDLERLFGGTRQTVSTADVFRDLDRKFKGNVFLIHRDYGSTERDRRALTVWRECLGDERIIPFGKEDRAIADLLLGLFAIVNGVRTLDAYLDDMVNARAKPQTPARIALVRKALTDLAAWVQTRPVPEDVSGGSGFPTPDDLNRELERDEQVVVDRYLAALREVLTNAKTRPKPDRDGWGYCKKPPLPDTIRDGSALWEFVREKLERSNWLAEIVDDPESDARIVRIRRNA